MMTAEVLGSGGGGAQRNTASYLSGTTQSQNISVAEPGEWTLVDSEAAGVQSTVTKAAGGAGVRHVLRSLTGTLITTGANSGLATVVVRDGASGLGTILYRFSLALSGTANTEDHFGLSDLNLIGSANTAMTIEFTAGTANLIETISASGYDTQ